MLEISVEVTISSDDAICNVSTNYCNNAPFSFCTQVQYLLERLVSVCEVLFDIILFSLLNNR